MSTACHKVKGFQLKSDTKRDIKYIGGRTVRKHRWLIGVVASILIIILGFVIQVEYGADESDRVIVDYTLNLYSAPECFNEAGFTNDISDATYGEVEESGEFLPESSCTAVAFQTSRGPLWFAWFMS